MGNGWLVVVVRVATQLHGYRQGHQQLDGTIELPKADQSLIDRLSDLAGPQRPDEKFRPYVSGYPLPSGKYYVLARTWQDLTVVRAGCVRTLSLIIPAGQWKQVETVRPYFAALREDVMPEVACPVEILPDHTTLPPVHEFGGDELLEALFLEDPKPVAVFDASAPELVAVRLLSALWPGLRERFSISTFALSPRKIDTRFFDVVFAPKDVRSRFANWPGRRIDARSGHTARHRWTGSIVDRVFHSPHPKLLDDRELDSLNDDERTTPSALRVALLWDELLFKLEKSPSAALGLLDVASSKFAGGGSSDMVQVRMQLANAAKRGAQEMLPADGWAFVTAMLRKVQDTPFASIVPAIAEASAILTNRFPAGAIALLEQPDPSGIYRDLLPSIAKGLTEGFETGAAQALADALPETLAWVLVSDDELARTSVASALLLRRISSILPAVSGDTFSALRNHLLPMLSTADHDGLATPFIASLAQTDLLAEVDQLSGMSKVSLPTFVPPIVLRARELDAELELRRKALSLGSTPLGRSIIRESLVPSARDVRWIIEEVPTDQAPELLVVLLRDASGPQLKDVFRDHDLAGQVVAALSNAHPDILQRIATETRLPLDLYVSVVARTIKKISGNAAGEFARQALERCLREHFVGDEFGMLRKLLNAARKEVDAGWIIHNGLAGKLHSSVVSRNMIVLASLDADFKRQIAKSIELVAEVLAGRWLIDLDASAAAALTNLIGVSKVEDPHITLRAAGRLLPALMRSTDHPISLVVSATFPHVYRELAREDEIPNFLKFISFFDWDRCKAARHELVRAFLKADAWQPSDFAITAWRSSDTERFMKRVAKSFGGESFLMKIEADTSKLPRECAEEVHLALRHIQNERGRR